MPVAGPSDSRPPWLKAWPVGHLTRAGLSRGLRRPGPGGRPPRPPAGGYQPGEGGGGLRGVGAGRGGGGGRAAGSLEPSLKCQGP